MSIIVFLAVLVGCPIAFLIGRGPNPLAPPVEITLKGVVGMLAAMSVALLLLTLTPLGDLPGWLAEQSARGTVGLMDGFEQGRQDGFEQGRQDGATP